MFPRLLLILICTLTPDLLRAANAPDMDEQTRAIAQELRCVVCQNLSVADSPSEMAQQMRGIVKEQLQAGKTPEEIKDFFVSKYGEWVLLAPTAQGFSLLLWVLPFVVLLSGIGLALWLARRWSARQKTDTDFSGNSDLLMRVRSEAAKDDSVDINPEDSSPRAQLLQERARLYAELRELEFDFQAGKLAESDYQILKLEIENKASLVVQQLDALPFSQPSPVESSGNRPARQPAGRPEKSSHRHRGWQLAAGATFLLLFGLTLGVVLTNSLRPRESFEDSMTGDFLTGTGSSENSQLLAQGKAAFAKQDWPRAIEAFKKVLVSDPNQPEAHAYMGYILAQAGHADGALMAFNKALTRVPNFPMALWGKGMILLREKQDYVGARETLAKLLRLLPAGAERSEVEKILAGVPQSTTSANQKTGAPTTSTGQQLSGRITIDPKLQGKVNSGATLFIIARPAGSTKGPPLAVKKIDRPVFPLSYSLGPENVMMQGLPFSGKVTVTARIDADGNPTTREAGDLSGDHKKNPATVGANNIDIVIDQVAQ
ncbi:MAG: cytochrome c-type biogenesis protein CcmH [Candidatus Binatia bacterium]